MPRFVIYGTTPAQEFGSRRCIPRSHQRTPGDQPNKYPFFTDQFSHFSALSVGFCGVAPVSARILIPDRSTDTLLHRASGSASYR